MYEDAGKIGLPYIGLKPVLNNRHLNRYFITAFLGLFGLQ